jgi:Protein of unknown function (DUF3486)
MSRTGKIARLPREIRDQLNQRLLDGQSGQKLLAWLNKLPEVQQVLAAEFDGTPINAPNLSHWKAGGYEDWLTRRETLEQARELAADSHELTAATDGKLTDHLATVLAARYAAALAEWNGEPDEKFERKLRILHNMCQDIVKLRRSDQNAARQNAAEKRQKEEEKKTESTILALFREWVAIPHVRDWICKDWLSPEEREQAFYKFYGYEEPPKAPGSESALYPPLENPKL